MSSEQINRIIDDSYDQSREEPIRTMGRDFFSRKFRSTLVFVWGWSAPFLALAVYSAVRFFKADHTQGQILYAALFIVATQAIFGMKVFAWQMLHQTSMRRDLKHLELRLAELSEMLKR